VGMFAVAGEIPGVPIVVVIVIVTQQGGEPNSRGNCDRCVERND
jgi:hypothetical protein